MFAAHTLDPLEAQAAEEIQGGEPIADQLSLEHLATGARDNAEGVALADAEGLARAEQCDVRHDAQCPVEGLVINPHDPHAPRKRILVVRPRRDARRLALAVLHELAHVLLARSGMPHSHADVWCLTLALALPLRVVRELRREGTSCARTIAARAGVPVWAVRIRLEMGVVAVAA